MDMIHYTRQVVSRKPVELHGQKSVTPVVRRVKEIPRFRLRRPGSPGETEMIIRLVSRPREVDLFQERMRILVQLRQRQGHLHLQGQCEMAEHLAWILRRLSEESPSEKPFSASLRIKELLQSPDLFMGRRLSVRELSKKAGMGMTTFRAMFQKITGRSPRAHLEELRVQKAAHTLIETDRKILDVAMESGYSDTYHFSRVFKRVMGQSPRTYRRIRRSRK